MIGGKVTGISLLTVIAYAKLVPNRVREDIRSMLNKKNVEEISGEHHGIPSMTGQQKSIYLDT